MPTDTPGSGATEEPVAGSPGTPEPDDDPAVQHAETVRLDSETVALSAPTVSLGRASEVSSLGEAAPSPEPSPSEVTLDPWGRPTNSPYVIAEPSSPDVPSFDAGGAPPEAPRRSTRTGLFVAVAALLVVVVAGVVLITGVFGDDGPDSPDPAAVTSPSAAAPGGSPTASTSPAATPSATDPSVTAPPQPVPGGPQPVAAWGVNGGRGDATIGGQDLTASNVTAVGGSGGFNGKDSRMTTAGPVVNTGAGRSFTIAASVFLAGTERYQTAVSQDGVVNSAFYLQYAVADKRWAFSRVVADKPNPEGIRALSVSEAVPQTWVRLVGVYDAPAGQLRLYVDGVPQGTKAYRAPFASTGKFVVGRGRYGGADADWFRGNIGDVRVYDRALTSAEIAKLPPRQ